MLKRIDVMMRVLLKKLNRHDSIFELYYFSKGD